MAGINYLFPPDQVLSLPTWRFVLHFETTPAYCDGHRLEAIASLEAAQWKIVTFPFGLDTLSVDHSGRLHSNPKELVCRLMQLLHLDQPKLCERG